jgi:hypothetical protein
LQEFRRQILPRSTACRLSFHYMEADESALTDRKALSHSATPELLQLLTPTSSLFTENYLRCLGSNLIRIGRMSSQIEFIDDDFEKRCRRNGEHRSG